MATAHQGATRSKSALSWGYSAFGPTDSVSRDQRLLQSRTRDAIRNNPWMGKAVHELVADTVGRGIFPTCVHDDDQINDRLTALWKESHPYLDATGCFDFYGLQAQLEGARRTDGEAFIRRRIRVDSDLPVPLQLQALESDFCPVEKTEDHKRYKTKSGIDISKEGKRIAYHFHREHPGEGLSIGSTFRVDAKNIIHYFKPARLGALRAAPPSAPSLLKANTFDEYDAAELSRKRTRAGYSGAITTDRQGPGAGVGDTSGDVDSVTGEPIGGGDVYTEAEPLNIGAGQFAELAPGESLVVFDGDKGGEGYKDFMREQKLAIAAGWRIPYELLTGDWTGVNDRLVRAILNQYRRSIEMDQYHLTIFQICRKVMEWWLDAAVLYGRIELPSYAERRQEYLNSFEWRPHAWGYINPEQDVNAAIKAIDSDLSTLDREAARRGGDAKDNIASNVRMRARRRDLEDENNLTEAPE